MSDKKSLKIGILISVAILLVGFIIRLFDQAQLLHAFPLDYHSNLVSYMAQLFFLDSCGYMNLCSYWYNGFLTFKFVAPGWFFFTLPLYYLFNKNVLFASYSSMILLFVLGFFGIYFLGRLHINSRLSRIAFFTFFFGNAIAIGNFVRLGRLHELMGWVLFIFLGLIFLYYRKKKLDWLFFLTGIIYGIILFTHQVVAILSSFLFLSLFLMHKERIKIIISWLIGFLIGSFWLIPYISSFGSSGGSVIQKTSTLLRFTPDLLAENIASFIIPLVFIVLFFFYWKERRKSTKELLFFAPFLVLAVLLFTRLIAFIPVLKYVYPDPYLHSFIFFSLFMLFKIKDFRFLNKFIVVLLILFAIISVGVSHFYTPYFTPHGDIEKDTLEVMGHVEGVFIFPASPSSGYAKAYYSYAPIFHNISSASGYSPQSVDYGYIDSVVELDEITSSRDCDAFLARLNELYVDEILLYDEDCVFFANECNLKQKIQKNEVCLLEVR